MLLECVLYCSIPYCAVSNQSINHGMIYASPIPNIILYYIMPFQSNSIQFHQLLKRSDKRGFHRKTSLTLQNSINQTILHSLMGLQILDTLHILSNNLQRLLTPSRNQIAHSLTIVHNLPRFDCNITRLSLTSRFRLRELNGSIGETGSLTSFSLG